MLKKFIYSLTAVMALSLVVMAYDGDAELTGFIVDKACATGKVAKQADPQAAALMNKSCMLPSCLRAGLAFTPTARSTRSMRRVMLAKAAIEKSKKDKGAKFKVTGKVSADKKVAVTGIEEVTVVRPKR